MKKIMLTAALVLCGAFTSMTPSVQAAEAPLVVAQGVDISVRPSGEGMERRERMERREYRTRRVVRVEGRRPMHGCRTVITRRMTPNGSVTRRVRSCG